MSRAFEWFTDNSIDYFRRLGFRVNWSDTSDCSFMSDSEGFAMNFSLDRWLRNKLRVEFRKDIREKEFRGGFSYDSISTALPEEMWFQEPIILDSVKTSREKLPIIHEFIELHTLPFLRRLTRGAFYPELVMYKHLSRDTTRMAEDFAIQHHLDFSTRVENLHEIERFLNSLKTGGIETRYDEFVAKMDEIMPAIAYYGELEMKNMILNPYNMSYERAQWSWERKQKSTYSTESDFKHVLPFGEGDNDRYVIKYVYIPNGDSSSSEGSFDVLYPITQQWIEQPDFQKKTPSYFFSYFSKGKQRGSQ